MHGFALGQYKIIPNGKVWDVVDCLGNLICWSFDSPFKATKHIQDILKMEKN